MWSNIRDAIGNKLAQWIMNHIHCYTSTFYICCSRYSSVYVKVMTNIYLESEEGKNN